MRQFLNIDTRRTNTGRVIAGAVVFLCSFFAGQVFFASAQTTSTVVSNEVTVYVRPKVSCDFLSFSDTNGDKRINIGEKVKWQASAEPVGAPSSYSYRWSSEGANPPSQGPDNRDTYEVTYSTIGKEKSITVAATPQVSVPPGVELSSSGTCKSPQVFEAVPDLTAAPPAITCEAWARLGTDTNGVQKCHKGSKLSIVGSISNIGTAATQNGAFASLYQYSTDERIWNDFSETTLQVDSAPLGAQGTVSATNRPLKPYSGTATEPWVAGYAPASDHYWHFRVCADQKNDGNTGYDASAGAIAEDNEGNNCSASTRLKILALKPDVTLWISRTGEPCKTLKQKQAVILKGNKALLCWQVTAIEVFE